MDTPLETGESSQIIGGVLKRTFIAEWDIALRHLPRARSELFYSEVGLSEVSLNSLVLLNESDRPENMMKLTLWFYTRALKEEHSLEVSLSLIDDENRQCYAVEKRLRNSTSETSKVCATLDFNIMRHSSFQKFFHEGALRIQCSIIVDMPESASSSLKPSKDEFNTSQDLFQKHLANIEKAGVLTKKSVFTLAIPESLVRTNKEVEVLSGPFTCSFEEFYFSKSHKLNKRLEICLKRNKPAFFRQNFSVVLAVLDNKGIMHYPKEEVTPDSSEIFFDFRKLLEDRKQFLDKGELKIYCSLQIDNVLKNSVIALKPGGSSETSKLTTVSSPTENSHVKTYSPIPSRTNKSPPTSVNKWFPRSAENSTPNSAAENSIYDSSKEEDKSKIKESLTNMLHLLQEPQVETVVLVYKRRNGIR